MVYSYRCKDCDLGFEKNYPIGQAGTSPACPDCNCDNTTRVYSCDFILKGGGWPSRSNLLNKEMTDRNERAGKRMRVEHGEEGPMKIVAHDYGNGDVREVKKKK